MRKTLSERSSLATLSDDTRRVATPNVPARRGGGPTRFSSRRSVVPIRLDGPDDPPIHTFRTHTGRVMKLALVGVG